MIKDILLGVGTVAGLGITGIGLLALFTRPDPRTTYAGERFAENVMGAVIGIPCLIVGVPMLALCVWGLVR